MNELMTKSIPVLAFMTYSDGSHSKLYGFVDSATVKVGLVISSGRGTPSVSSTICVPFLEGCTCFKGTAEDLDPNIREDLVLTHGNTSLLLFLPSGTRLALFFTS